MAMHPTFTHAAADMRRKAFLAEAAEAQRIALPGSRNSAQRASASVLRFADRMSDMISRIVDDFEPGPSSSSPVTGIMPRRASR